MLFDSHNHVHFPAYDGDRDAVIKRAQQAGVKMITVGTNYQTSKEAIVIAEKYPDDIWATVGFHPSHVFPDAAQHGVIPNASGDPGSHYNWHFDKKELRRPIQEKFDAANFRELTRHSKVVAIGECGLDYYRLPAKNDRAIKNLQKKIFFEQIQLAEEVGKPLMVHCRPSKGTDDAYEDLIEILKNKNSKLKTIVHFHVGSLAITKKLLELECLFTFGGVTTFSSDYDEVIKYLPLENILLETDAPYVAPEPYRGQRNEPAHVVEIAKKIAAIKKISYETLISQTTSNALKIFTVQV